MRTVSFSQPQIQNRLNRDFVCTFTSTEGDATAGKSIQHRPDDPAGFCLRGNGQQNVQTLFMIPEGQIFHVVSGFISSEELADELVFAGDLFAKLRAKPAGAEELVVSTHRQRLKELGFDAAEIESNGPSFGGMAMPFNVADMANGNLRSMGSSNRSNSQNGEPNGLFDKFIRAQILTDHQFCLRHPLVERESFQRDPAMLVGNGQSFFMSSSSGSLKDR